MVLFYLLSHIGNNANNKKTGQNIYYYIGCILVNVTSFVPIYKYYYYYNHGWISAIAEKLERPMFRIVLR